MKTKQLLTLFCVLLFATVSYAQTVTVSGEIRPRSEYAHGFGRLAFENQGPAVNTTQRTRLNLMYSDLWFTSKVVFQDVRRWGNQIQLVQNEDNATSIHEAWAEAYFLDNFSAKIGRQELVYDNHRILGNVGWAQQARSHDVVLFTYDKKFSIHVGVAHHDDGDLMQDTYNGPDAYKNMQFIWFNKKWDEATFSFLILNNGVPCNKEVNGGQIVDQEDRYSQTFGPYFKWDSEGWILEANAYLQTGESVTNTPLSLNQKDISQDLMAYEFLIEGKYLFDENWSLGAGFELLSGTDYDENNDNNSFKPLYGTNHKFNGFMDYFFVGADGNSFGIMDAILRVGYKKERFKYDLALHSFWTHRKQTNSADKHLGIEADLSFGYAISKSMQLAAGYSHLFAAESIELIKSGDRTATHNWGYVMVTFKPVFFNNK